MHRHHMVITGGPMRMEFPVRYFKCDVGGGDCDVYEAGSCSLGGARPDSGIVPVVLESWPLCGVIGD